MNSNMMKYALCHYWRYVRKADYIATEVGSYMKNIPDILLICKDKIIEVEIKVSVADLKADFKKEKHAKYAAKINSPYYFYFAFPFDLKIEPALLADYPDYGILRVYFHENIPMVRAEKTPRRIGFYSDLYFENIKRDIFNRMSSELVCLRKKVAFMKGLNNG